MYKTIVHFRRVVHTIVSFRHREIEQLSCESRRRKEVRKYSEMFDVLASRGERIRESGANLLKTVYCCDANILQAVHCLDT